MYAVIKTGGKQYRVKEGDYLKVELLPTEVGNQINFSDVLMLTNADNTEYGNPMINKAVVQAEVVEHGRHDKIKIIKFRRRKHYMRRMGHRQYYTQVKITKINNSQA